MRKRVYSILLLIFVSNLLSAQTSFNMDWQRFYQHTLSDFYSNQSRAVVTDPTTGNVFIIADVTSDLDSNGMASGGSYSYIQILKFDEGGTALGTKLIDVGMHSVSGIVRKSTFGAISDDSGNLFIGFSFYSSTTDFDIRIIKMDQNLNTIWNYDYIPSTINTGIAMKVVPNGTVYALIKSASSTGNIRYQLLKCNGNGSSSFPLYSFSSAPIFLNSLAVDPASEDIFVTGYKDNITSKELAFASVSSMGSLRYLKYEDFGTASGEDVGKQISLGNDGSVFITGNMTGTVSEGTNVVTLKYDAQNGKKIWQNIIDIGLDDQAAFVISKYRSVIIIVFKSGGNIYLKQILNNIGTTGVGVQYSPIPSTPYSSIDGVEIADIKFSPNNNIYVTGTVLASSTPGNQFSSSFLIKINTISRGGPVIEMQNPVAGNISESSKASGIALGTNTSNVFILQDLYYSLTTHIQEKVNLVALKSTGIFRSDDEQDQNDFVTIHSATTIDKLELHSTSPIKYIALFDLSGRRIKEIILPETGLLDLEMNIGDLRNGIYLINIINTQNGKFSSKVVKF